MISVDRALEIVLEHASAPARARTCALGTRLGRVLAEDVAADHDFPPFDRSAMDGFALRSGDAGPSRRGSGGGGPGPGRAVARRGALETGEAIEIMTGAPLPPGADAVQQVEKTKPARRGWVEILAPVEPGQNVRGPRVRGPRRRDGAGPRADASTPPRVAVLASVGKARVRVGERPTLSVLVTGDELVEVDEKPTAARIRNSNGYAVLAQATGRRRPRRFPWASSPTTRSASRARSSEGLASDVLVLSGGVSEGVYDLVEDVLRSLRGGDPLRQGRDQAGSAARLRQALAGRARGPSPAGAGRPWSSACPATRSRRR